MNKQEQLYRALIFVLPERNGSEPLREDRYTVEYLADSPGQAIVDAKRWFENRHCVWSELFHTLACVKIYSVTPQRMDESGYLRQDHGFDFFEWKFDWGYPYEMARGHPESKR